MPDFVGRRLQVAIGVEMRAPFRWAGAIPPRGTRVAWHSHPAMSAARPRPEDFLELVERAKRGRLKLYLGFAAGVGKTYRMLEEAHALKKRGVDVVVGYVETHGRSETAALVEGLEVIPRRKIG